MLLNYRSAWRKTCRHHIWKTPSENAPRHPTLFITGSSPACSRKRGKGSNIHKPPHSPSNCAFIQWLIWLTHSILPYSLNHHNLKHLLVLLFVVRGKTPSLIKIMNRVNEQMHQVLTALTSHVLHIPSLPPGQVEEGGTTAQSSQ